jgi:co-chaperonin GroES (HSP10)
MPAVAMHHEEDPRPVLLRKIGSVDGFEVFHNQVLIAVYISPEKTQGGIIRPDNNRDEDRYQGKVGLILKCGPGAFNDATGRWHWPEDIGVGDWVYFRVSDGWNLTINSHRDNICRQIEDIDIRGRIQHPDQVW